MMGYLLELLAIYLGADFMSGLFHWIEDTYLDHTASNPYIKYVATLNEEHHESPQKFTECHPLENILTSIPIYLVVVTLTVLLPVKCLGMSTHNAVVIGSMCTFALFANLFHRWCHTKPPKIISLLQQLRILQTPHHHMIHHYAENAKIPRLSKGTFYCVIGNMMNPLLESIDFWRSLEWIIFKISGIKPLWYQ